MEEKGAVTVVAPSVPQPRVSSPTTTVTVSAPSSTMSEIQSRRFRVALTPGDTTIVSWKKLLKGAAKGNGGSCSDAPSQAVGSGISSDVKADQPVEGEKNDGQPPSHRFSAVIEKIERLYMGNESSDDEEFGDVPDDDQYDTDDSFIDDDELNDYFQVDKSEMKHNGFFVNRGKLERRERSSSPNTTSKKRRRKDSMQTPCEKVDCNMPTDHVHIRNVKMKAAARNAPLIEKKLQNSPSMYHRDPQQERNFVKKKSTMNMGSDKKKTGSSMNINACSYSKHHKDLVNSVPVKDFKKQMSSIQSRDVASKSRVIEEPINSGNEVSRGKGNMYQVETHIKSSKDGNDMSKKYRHRDSNGNNNLPDLNSPGTGSHYSNMSERSKQVKESGVIKPKGTTLDRAIQELEKVVTEYRPQKADVKEADGLQGVKKRLPVEVKHKLAKVARLADRQGRLTSQPFLDRLMSILGHLVQLKTLKRNMKEMVELGLSVKRAKDDKFQKIKKDVIEMIKKSKVTEQQTSLSADFQETPSERTLKSRYLMDVGIEDKICDLYDLYVEGMDEDKGPQARKLYVELAELWPAGYMDNLGIKDAVYRAKERKRANYKQKYKIREDERAKRKRHDYRMADNARLKTHASVGPEKSAVDSSGKLHILAQRVGSSHITSPSSKMSEPVPSSNGMDIFHAIKHHEKVQGGTSSIASDEASKAIIAAKKKSRRKTDTDSGTVIHTQSMKLPLSHQSDLKEKSQRLPTKASECVPGVIALPSATLNAPPKQPN